MRDRFKLTPFENTSILRKLTIIYFLISIVPVGVLYYLYMEMRDKGRLEITEESFALTLFFVVTGVAIGYFAIRSLIVKIISITKKNREVLEELLGPDTIGKLLDDENNEIAVLARSFHEITSRLEDNVRNLQSAKKTLHSVLARVGEGISSMENINSFLNLILETVTDALQCKSGVLLLLDREANEFYVQDLCGEGFSDKAKSIRISYSHEAFNVLKEGRQAMIIRFAIEDKWISELFKPPALVAPLVLHDMVSGVIAVHGSAKEEGFQQDELELMYNLALQTAVAIENSKLSADAERTYFETISALALAVEAKDPYSRGHSERVANYAVEIAKNLSLSEEEVRDLRDAAKLHDIGKIGITDEILKKAGPLDVQEIAVMQKHVEIGEGIIKPIRSLKRLCDVVRHHHEKLDGSGYPDHLKNDQLGVLVRILAAADIFDALTSNRPYREPFSDEKAIEKLREMKNEIDQKIVDVLAKIVL